MGSSSNGFDLAALGTGTLAAIAIACIAVGVLLIVAQWKMFTKAGVPGWFTLIPFAGTWQLYKIATGRGANMFKVLIPVYGEIYAAFIIPWKLTRAYGHSGGFYVGMLFLTPIFEIILGFDKNEYIGPQ